MNRKGTEIRVKMKWRVSSLRIGPQRQRNISGTYLKSTWTSGYFTIRISFGPTIHCCVSVPNLLSNRSRFDIVSNRLKKTTIRLLGDLIFSTRQTNNMTSQVPFQTLLFFVFSSSSPSLFTTNSTQSVSRFTKYIIWRNLEWYLSTSPMVTPMSVTYPIFGPLVSPIQWTCSMVLWFVLPFPTSLSPYPSIGSIFNRCGLKESSIRHKFHGSQGAISRKNRSLLETDVTVDVSVC